MGLLDKAGIHLDTSKIKETVGNVLPEKPQVQASGGSPSHNSSDKLTPIEAALKVHMPGAPEGTMVVVGQDQVKRVYEDPVGAKLICVVDEVAELLLMTGLKSEAGKQEDALKQEIIMILSSIAQLGRSGMVHLILATQRNDTALPADLPVTVYRPIEHTNSLSEQQKASTKKLIESLGTNFSLRVDGNTTLEKQEILWSELEPGDIFEDGSIVNGLSTWFEDNTYTFETDSGDTIEASAGHLFKVRIEDDGEVINNKLPFEFSADARKATFEVGTEWVCAYDLWRLYRWSEERGCSEDTGASEDDFSSVVKGSIVVYNLDVNGEKTGKIISVKEARFGTTVRCITTDIGEYNIRGFQSHNTIIPGSLQNNSLALDTKVIVRRKVEG